MRYCVPVKYICVKAFSFILKIGYGLTELSPLCCHTAIDDPIDLRVSTVGKMLPSTEVGTKKRIYTQVM